MTKLDQSNCKDFIRSIDSLKSQLSNKQPLGFILHKAKSIMSDYSRPADDELQSIVDSYGLMSDYMLRGYQDHERADLYHKLSQRLYRKLSDVQLEARKQFDPVVSSLVSREASHVDVESLRNNLELFVSDLAMLTLEPEEKVADRRKALYERRHKMMSNVFNQILCSGQWSNEHAVDIANLILSPLIDLTDSLSLCAAVMMASLLSPDPVKVLLLLKVYKEATDAKLKQRALIGWVFALDNGDFSLFPEINESVKHLIEDKNLRDELVELQMQVVFCMSAEQDTKTIERDVMPNIIKNQNLEVTRFGIREKEDNPMDDILHGDSSDKKIEEMEQSMRKMAEMQKRGADIYFGGFSKMKRFGFFFTLSNWFTPFYMQHPGLGHLAKEIHDTKFMSSLLSTMPFCDSDKYSFALAMSSVFPQLPDNIKEMVANNAGMVVPGMEGVMNTSTFFRRQYLQDLYRFFRINDSRKAFADPFSYDDNRMFLSNPAFHETMHDGAIGVVGFLMKRKLYVLANVMLDEYFDENQFEDNILAGRIALKNGDFTSAEKLFAKAYEIEGHGEKSLKGYALACFRCAHYEKAIELYHRLTEIYPEKSQYKMDEAIALINDKKEEEAVKILYELYYNDQANIEVKRVLAWGLLCIKQTEKASRFYEDIIASGNGIATDYLNAGYCSWFDGHGEAAAKDFAEFVSIKSAEANKTKTRLRESILSDKFKEDASLLDSYDIPAIDRLIMAGIA